MGGRSGSHKRNFSFLFLNNFFIYNKLKFSIYIEIVNMLGNKLVLLLFYLSKFTIKI